MFTLSGLCSGLTEAFVINPFEVVKVKLQAERDVFKKVQYGISNISMCRGSGQQKNKGVTTIFWNSALKSFCKYSNNIHVQVFMDYLTSCSYIAKLLIYLVGGQTN